MIHLKIPTLPPSSNHAYFNLPSGGRVLSTEGKKYKNETKTYLAKNYQPELRQFVPNSPYLVYMRFHLSALQNATWGKPKGAESRYKKIDASNRAKLLEDVLKDVSGVDDSNTMVIILEKKLAQGEERTEVFIWNLDTEESPFDVARFSR
jgi:Holliday junction resolvase RusA-like endonuclease